jgi:hypothetical protein
LEIKKYEVADSSKGIMFIPDFVGSEVERENTHTA